MQDCIEVQDVSFYMIGSDLLSLLRNNGSWIETCFWYAFEVTVDLYFKTKAYLV